jgi:transglutaminase/protease-like cytokinesis protein 3
VNLDASVTQIVSYYEVEINVAYRKITKEQLDSIITISTLRYLKSDLQDMLVDYAPSMTVLLKNVDLTADEALSYVSEIYYENPLDIVMMPVSTVEFYPNHGTERIMEFIFGYRYEDSTLGAMEKSLKNTVSNIAESVTGNSDGAILLSLARRLTEISEYDEETAANGEYSNQNTAATAYGALITGSAIGEGYAMAYKALCDDLDLECHVVLGTYNGKAHAWNIVTIEDHFYHVDVAMCDVGGMAAAFLKKDSDMKKYKWDKDKYEVCDGPLTYAALTGNS